MTQLIGLVLSRHLYMVDLKTMTQKRRSVKEMKSKSIYVYVFICRSLNVNMRL